MKIDPDDRQIAVAGRWAVATDGLQWILQRYFGNRWRPISFVRSTKTILARCMREADADPSEIDALLTNVPNRFQETDKISAHRGSIDLIPAKAPSAKRHNKSLLPSPDHPSRARLDRGWKIDANLRGGIDELARGEFCPPGVGCRRAP
jgi:hypothetical protein